MVVWESCGLSSVFLPGVADLESSVWVGMGVSRHLQVVEGSWLAVGGNEQQAATHKGVAGMVAPPEVAVGMVLWCAQVVDVVPMPPMVAGVHYESEASVLVHPLCLPSPAMNCP